MLSVGLGLGLRFLSQAGESVPGPTPSGCALFTVNNGSGGCENFTVNDGSGGCTPFTVSED